MAQTYEVQKGDTLGAIAKKFGTNIGDISGFRSGNVDLIFPGEKLTIGTPEVSKETTRADTIRTELTPPTPDVTAEVPEPTTDVGQFQTDLSEATKLKDEAFEELKGFRTKRYDELREERGLETNRTEIDSLDKQISQKKQERDDSIATAKRNPGASAATITGEVRGITDQLNAGINNLIEQRNSQANSYNTSLAEIDRIVASEAGDLESTLEFYTGAETRAGTSLDAYNKAVIDELRRTEDISLEEARDIRDFQQALEVARIRGTGSDSGTTYQLKFDPITGESFLFNPDTGDVQSPDEVELDESSAVVNQSVLPVVQQQTSEGGFLKGLFGGVKDFFSGN